MSVVGKSHMTCNLYMTKERTHSRLLAWSNSGADGGDAASFTGGGRWIPDCILAAAAAVEDVEQLLFCFEKKGRN